VKIQIRRRPLHAATLAALLAAPLACKPGGKSGSSSTPPPPDGGGEGEGGGDGGDADGSPDGEDGDGQGAVALHVGATLALETGAEAPTVAIAVPVQGGLADATALKNATSAPITAGTLSLDVGKGAALNLLEPQASDYVIAVYDDEKPDVFSQGETFKFITAQLQSSSADGVLGLPAPKDGASLDFGTVPLDASDQAAAEGKLDAAAFTVPKGVIEELTRTDKALKAIKNTFMNTQASKGIDLTAAVSFSWGIDPRPLLDDQTKTSVGGDAVYFGYGINFQGHHPDVKPAEVCGAADNAQFKKFTLTPPATICATDRGKTPADCGTADAAGKFGFDVLDNADATAMANNSGRDGCYSDDHQPMGKRMHLFGIGQDPAQNGKPGTLNFNWAGGWGFYGEMPAGYWDLKLEDKLIGRFDLAPSYPFVKADNAAKTDTVDVPRVYIPGVKITTTGTPPARQLTKVEVVFYLAKGLDENDHVVFEPVTDYAAMRRVFKDGAVTLAIHDFGIDGGRDGVWAIGEQKLPASGNGPVVFDVGAIDSGASDPLPDSAWYYCDSGRDGAGDASFFCDTGFETNHKIATDIGVQYMMYGNQYMFSIRIPIGGGL
jgi:hypothetical protein